MDFLTPQQRSERMSRIRGTNTKPELALRLRLFALGFRYRLHSGLLPGRPDLIFPARCSVVFVHGCFWHGHNCKIGHVPKSNSLFWSQKINANRARDRRNERKIRAMGWRVKVIWECELNTQRKAALAAARVAIWLGPRPRGQ
jgi:DNA mismatch endonuclease, patch repair protein